MTRAEELAGARAALADAANVLAAAQRDVEAARRRVADASHAVARGVALRLLRQDSSPGVCSYCGRGEEWARPLVARDWRAGEDRVVIVELGAYVCRDCSADHRAAMPPEVFLLLQAGYEAGSWPVEAAYERWERGREALAGVSPWARRDLRAAI